MSGGANRKPLFSGLPLVGLTALLFRDAIAHFMFGRRFSGPGKAHRQMVIDCRRLQPWWQTFRAAI